MLEPDTLPFLRKGRNLLAFSAGVDSSALFHLLLERNIPFDLAMVDYRTRFQSEAEAAHAQALAERHGKRLHLLVHPLDPRMADFEAAARKVRYDWFEEIIEAHGYDALITAHQLDDLLEWHLMQLCRGAGCAELVGMSPIEKRGLGIGHRGSDEGKKHYLLIRPLLFTPKKALLEYLERNTLPYFVDESNESSRHTRNRFRQQAARFLMEECPEGIARSFRYMLQDREALRPEPEIFFTYRDLTLFRRPADRTTLMRQIGTVLKAKGYLSSRAQKEEAAQKGSVVIGGQWAVEVDQRFVWIAPYRITTMSRSFRERCRKARIPEKVRPYLFETEGLEPLLSTLESFSS